MRPWTQRVGLTVVLTLLAGCGQPGQEPTTVVPRAEPHSLRSQPAYPPTRVEAVVDRYHGVAVTDPYRWLEDSDSDAVRAWTAAQNAHTQAVLERLPGREALARRVREVLGAPVASYLSLLAAGEHWFVLVRQPPRQQPFLAVMPAGAPADQARVVLDPAQLDPSGKTTIDWYVPAPDGQRVAVSLSVAGTESGDVHILDVRTGAIEERVLRVNGGTAGGDLAWTADGRGFYYTRYPHPGERPAEDLDFYQQLYFHQLGTPQAEDRYELGRDFPRIAEIRVDLDRASGRVLVAMQKGDGGEFTHHLRARDGRWQQLTRYEDRVVDMAFGPGSDLFAISRLKSPLGELLRLAGDKPALQTAARIYTAEDATLVSDFWDGGSTWFGAERWLAVFQLGGPSEVRAFDYAGKRLPLEQPLPVASFGQLTGDGSGGALLQAESFVQPAAWYRVTSDAATPVATPLADGAPLAMDGYEVVREQATSKDGTRVPVSILLPRNRANADKPTPGPCVVNGYGGYGVSLDPRYSPRIGLWLERGVCFAVANLRGGGEFGEAWHQAGMLTRKQNVFDDFAAVLQHMIARGYTDSERLGILGGSNGGLLMGATVVQHPALTRAVVSFVGIYDMLRVELSPNGAFNVTEFGTVEDPGQFEALHAYSPYHHVRDGVVYPAMLMITGDNDPRVEPMRSRKMAARLQAAQAGEAPVLLHVHADSGHHSSALDQVVDEAVDVYGFMLHALGVTVR